ncbi:MAG: hypothetical protein ACYDHC_06240 [Desulfuromonadaceae bacterium]
MVLVKNLDDIQSIEYDLHMILHRFLFVHVLLVILLALPSVAATAAAALLQGGAAPACCEADSDRSAAPFDAPCSVPDCQCVSCLAFMMPLCSRQPVHNGIVASLSFSRLATAPSLEYFKAIDYPPEFS